MPAAIIICISALSPSISAMPAPAVVDFEALAPTATYGLPDDSPEHFAFSQNGIDVYLQELLVNSAPQFYLAEVGGRNVESWPTQAMSLDNISLLFDFSSVGFEVNLVTIEFLEFGGVNNFAVNGGPSLELLSFNDLPLSLATGIHASVGNGVITLTTDPGISIASLLIGGQELGIDNITAVPEPAPAAILVAGTALALLRARRRGTSGTSDGF